MQLFFTKLAWAKSWLVGCFGFNGPFRQYFSLYRVGWLVGFGFNGPLRQYFSLYRALVGWLFLGLTTL